MKLKISTQGKEKRMKKIIMMLFFAMFTGIIMFFFVIPVVSANQYTIYLGPGGMEWHRFHLNDGDKLEWAFETYNNEFDASLTIGLWDLAGSMNGDELYYLSRSTPKDNGTWNCNRADDYALIIWNDDDIGGHIKYSYIINRKLSISGYNPMYFIIFLLGSIGLLIIKRNRLY